jgi:hypothetical protein
MLAEGTYNTEQLLRLVMFGHVHFQSLWAGVELGVFELLDKQSPRSLEEIAAATNLALRPAKMVMANLSALGLVKKGDGKFSNLPVAQKFLVQSSEENLAPVLRWAALVIYPGIEDYVRSLRENRNVGVERFKGTGSTIYERLSHDPALEKVFQDAMANMPSNRFLAPNFNLTDSHHLCDCGGGAGHNAIALARHNPALRITIFDHASICERAESNIRESGLGHRVLTHPGNFVEDPFPAGIDAILYAHIAPIWSEETNLRIFRKAHGALPPGGTFTIYNMTPDDDQTGPLSVTCGSVYFQALATGEGFMFSAADYQQMLAEAGFGRIAIEAGLPAWHVLITATK